MTERPPVTDVGPQKERGPIPPSAQLIVAAYRGDLERVKTAIQQGADVNYVDPETGLSALHIAVGTNDLELCRYLIDECRASLFPDSSGRWPTLIAAQCQAGDALSDYIVEKEAASLPQTKA